jgi:hypothetical protein
MKLNLKSKKINIRLLLNILLVIVIAIELYYVYFALYKSLNPQPVGIIFNRIVRLDLKSYQDTTNLIQSRQNYQPVPTNFLNSNPFKYSD